MLPAGEMSAQTPPKPPKLGQPTQLIGLRNRSAEPIIEAQVSMGQSAYVTGISATLKSGKQLQVENLNECRKNLIVVDDNRIEEIS
jgi:hypothetical protein